MPGGVVKEGRFWKDKFLGSPRTRDSPFKRWNLIQTIIEKDEFTSDSYFEKTTHKNQNSDIDANFKVNLEENKGQKGNSALQQAASPIIKQKSLRKM